MTSLKEETLQKFHYLWKVDDKDWVTERKEQWKYLAANNFPESSSKSLKKYAQYFVKGERDEYIGETIEFLFTPYDSAECARSIFYSDIFTPYDRSRIFCGFIESASKFGKGLPWLRQHILWFVDGVMGKAYEVIKEQDGQDYRTLSTDPTSLCGSYCVKAIQVLEGELEYHGVVDYLEYFVSTLPYAIDASYRKYTLIDKLVSVSESVAKNNSASPLVIDYANRVLSFKEEILNGWSLNSHLDQGEFESSE